MVPPCSATRRRPATGPRRSAPTARRPRTTSEHSTSRRDTSTVGLGDLLDRRAYACYLSGDFPAALEAQHRALTYHRAAKDGLRLGQAARLYSLLRRYEGDLGQAWEVGREAVSVLETMPASHELALAYCNLSHLAVASEDGLPARAWAARAVATTDAPDVEVDIYASINVGSMELIEGASGGIERLEHSLKLAIDHGFEEHAGRAYVNLTWWSPRRRTYAEVERHFEPGLRYTEERGLDLWHSYLLAYRARAGLDRGRWDEAVLAATAILRNPRTSPVPRIVALAVLGLVRARRGDPEVWDLLDEAWALARHTGELQRIEPIAMARAEAYWLAGQTGTGRGSYRRRPRAGREPSIQLGGGRDGAVAQAGGWTRRAVSRPSRSFFQRAQRRLAARRHRMASPRRTLRGGLGALLW